MADELEKAVAKFIIGPRNPVPDSSKFSLEELQEVRWQQASTPDRNEALWIARAIIPLVREAEREKVLLLYKFGGRSEHTQGWNEALNAVLAAIPGELTQESQP